MIVTEDGQILARLPYTIDATSQLQSRDVIGHRAIIDSAVSCMFMTVVATNDQGQRRTKHIGCDGLTLFKGNEPCLAGSHTLGRPMSPENDMFSTTGHLRSSLLIFCEAVQPLRLL